MNLEEILNKAIEEGLCTRRELAIALFPDSSVKSRNINFNKMFRGENKTIRIDHIGIICKMCGCTPNELFENK